MSTLPPEQLKILELAYFSGYTHVEVADILDLPLGTVKGRMRLGLKKIRAFFDPRDEAVPR
jgi:RNA polymerase sigma-70 factor (ECF subfamily)